MVEKFSGDETDEGAEEGAAGDIEGEVDAYIYLGEGNEERPYNGYGPHPAGLPPEGYCDEDTHGEMIGGMGRWKTIAAAALHKQVNDM